MKVNVKGHIRDLLAFRGLVGKRQKRIAKASAEPIGLHPVNRVAKQLHPDSQHLVIASIRDETETAKTFRMVADREAGTEQLAIFRAGQYLSLKVDMDGTRITRPYSISSAPSEALGEEGFYDITIRRELEGFLTPHIWRNWDVGAKVQASGPCGFFYHEPPRDSSMIVGLAGGSGITPFRSMAREIVAGQSAAELLLLYGSADENDILFYEEFQELERQTAGKVRVVHVLSCDEVSLAGCEQGFITADVIRRHADVDDSSFFVCGPQAMYRFVESELATLDLPPRRIRREVRGEVKDIMESAGFPTELAGETFRVKVRMAGLTSEVEAKATETILVALERANLAPPSQCRSGECGFCRSQLVSGDVYVYPENDGRRAADRQFGYIHPCSTYPISNLEVVVPETCETGGLTPMQKNGYKLLAERLDALPNGFPPTDDGAELRLLAKLFSEEEAALAAQLRLALETPKEIAARLDLDSKELRSTLKDMAKRGLIAAGRTDRGLGYGLMPFAIGIYEYQFDKIDEEFARLFEDYYQKAFGQSVDWQPALMRVLPVGETIQADMEVRPYESVLDIINASQAYGVVDCICRTQQALVGNPCDHPVDVCMMLSPKPGVFDRAPNVRTLTREEAVATLKRASDAGLVHSVSNTQEGLESLWFICNCCTCSCAILRSMADLGMANVIARSAFVNQVDEELCMACGICVDACPFDALELEDVVVVDKMRCVGCGVCVPTCPEEALVLVRRPEDEILPTPVTEKDWMVERSASRGLDLLKVL